VSTPAPCSMREALPSDTTAIMDLVRRSLGEGAIPRSEAYWRWKHADNPFGPSAILLAEDGGTLIGLRAFMRWDWWSGGQRVPAVRAVDTATHPDWRGRGVFSTLTRALVTQVSSAGVGFVFNTPNEKSRPGYLKMGWTSLGRLPLHLRPIRPLRLASSLVFRRRDDTPVDRHVASPADVASHPHLSRVLPDTEAHGERLATRVDAAYLRWRYVDVPGIVYHASHCLDDDGAAAIVWRVKPGPRGLRECRVCEVLIAQHPRARVNAVQLLRDACRQSEADYASAMAAPGSVTHDILRTSGFLQIKGVGPIFTVRDLGTNASPVDPTLLRHWQPSIGALELF
jgi:GNAT superfamily N-acetyltransferase